MSETKNCSKCDACIENSNENCCSVCDNYFCNDCQIYHDEFIPEGLAIHKLYFRIKKDITNTFYNAISDQISNEKETIKRLEQKIKDLEHRLDKLKIFAATI